MTTQLWILIICSIIGLFDTAYLIYHKLRGTDVACVFFPKEWCYKVQHASQSKTFGIPNSMLGFVMYAAILIVTLLVDAGRATLMPLQLIIGVGFLFSLYFTYIQAFVLRAFCTWCVVSALNFTVMAAVIFLG